MWNKVLLFSFFFFFIFHFEWVTRHRASSSSYKPFSRHVEREGARGRWIGRELERKASEQEATFSWRRQTIVSIGMETLRKGSGYLTQRQLLPFQLAANSNRLFDKQQSVIALPAARQMKFISVNNLDNKTKQVIYIYVSECLWHSCKKSVIDKRILVTD